jgi:phage-related tail protein
MRAINNTLTSFLVSASKVEETRRRYLEMVGISEKKIDDFINETDQALTDLLGAEKQAKDIVKDTEAFKSTIEGIIKRNR